MIWCTDGMERAADIWQPGKVSPSSLSWLVRSNSQEEALLGRTADRVWGLKLGRLGILEEHKEG